jgi:hypothetical protein
MAFEGRDEAANLGAPPKPAPRGSMAAAAPQAVDQFCRLTGRAPDSVTGAKKSDDGDGWSFLVDVVELERSPPTMSIMATYRVESDSEGNLVSYERLRRFTRCATD